MTSKRRVLLLGLDGATFDLLLPWSQRGYLPNFARMMQEGAHGQLLSTNPPITPSAWTTCFTGVPPEQHGIYDFLTSHREKPSFAVVNSTMIRSARLWELPGLAEKRTILQNVPYTYPISPLNGLMVSGLPTPSGVSNYCYPDELRTRLEKEAGPILLNIDLPEFDAESLADALRFLDAIEAMHESRCRISRYLLESEDWDFFMAVFVFFDRVQHLFWKILDPATEEKWTDQRSIMIRERIFGLARKWDRFWGEIMAALQAGDTLLLVSDHGFGPTETWMNINGLLEREGLLVLQPSAVRKSRLFYRAMSAGESSTAQRLLPQSLRSAVRRRIRRRRSSFRSPLGEAIDWSKTRAYFASIPGQGIYINAKDREGRGVVEHGIKYQEVKQRILDLIQEEAARFDKGIEIQFTLKEERQGPCAELAPDIHFRLNHFGILGRPILGARRIWDDAQKTPIGFHRPEGIFCAWGEDVRQGAALPEAHMRDVAPTIFHLLDLPVPDYFQGEVLHAVWKSPHSERRVQIDRTKPPSGMPRKSTGEDEILTGLRIQGYFD